MIGARARLIVGKIGPGVAILAVVFPDGSPLAFAEIGAPQLPRRPGVPALLKARPFCRPAAIDGWRLGHRLLLASYCRLIRPQAQSRDGSGSWIRGGAAHHLPLIAIKVTVRDICDRGEIGSAIHLRRWAPDPRLGASLYVLTRRPKSGGVTWLGKPPCSAITLPHLATEKPVDGNGVGDDHRQHKHSRAPEQKRK